MQTYPEFAIAVIHAAAAAYPRQGGYFSIPQPSSTQMTEQELDQKIDQATDIIASSIESAFDKMVEYSTTIPGIDNLLIQEGLNSQFYEDLFENDSDWSLVIKGHALIEMTLNKACVLITNNPDLYKFFSKLDTSSDTKSKLAFLRATGHFKNNLLKPIVKWSELRNLLIHDIFNVKFNFSDYLSSKDSSGKRAFYNNFNPHNIYDWDAIPEHSFDDAIENTFEFMFDSITAITNGIYAYALMRNIIEHPHEHAEYYTLLNDNERDAMEISRLRDDTNSARIKEISLGVLARNNIIDNNTILELMNTKDSSDD